MRFLVVLLLVFQVNSLQADEIFNLIKIPNLEVYKIDNNQGLKYLNSKQNFIIGVKNNIKCEKANKTNLANTFSILERNLEKYDAKFLKKINLRFIVLCENLYISEINTAGIPDYKKRTLILDINFEKKYFERVIHHEIFHLVYDSFKEFFNDTTWSDFNKKSFKYAECSTCSDRLNLDLYDNTDGFVTEYSKSIPSEDMAEVFSFLIFDRINLENKSKNDPILLNKINYIKSGLDKINKL